MLHSIDNDINRRRFSSVLRCKNCYTFCLWHNYGKPTTSKNTRVKDFCMFSTASISTLHAWEIKRRPNNNIPQLVFCSFQTFASRPLLKSRATIGTLFKMSHGKDCVGPNMIKKVLSIAIDSCHSFAHSMVISRSRCKLSIHKPGVKRKKTFKSSA